MFNCSLCPHRCGAVRTDDHGEGRCHMPSLPKVARAALHFGEEPPISGTNGSGTIFFSGCTLSCLFCQNHTISHDGFGKTITDEQLATLFKTLVEQGAHNINLVTPSHYVHSIRRALTLYKPPVPVVYNSSGYERVETLRSLEGLVDIYLPDFKYADNALAKQLSGIDAYRETALAAIEEMIRQTGFLRTDDNGLAVKGTLVRHLVLPGHTANSLAVLSDLASHFGTDVPVSLLFQYTPIGDLPYKELCRRTTKREYQKVFDRLCELGLENGFVQEPSSADASYIPSFDLTGV